MKSGIDIVKFLALAHTAVGSRVTCNPPSLDTDEDFLVLATERNYKQLRSLLFAAGFTMDGSEIVDACSDDGSDWFRSFKRGDENLIVTTNDHFHDKFLAATSVAKRLNIMHKADRVALFQAVLYGNSCE